MNALDARAQRAPKTLEQVAAAARDLANQGFSDHTVAAILKIDVSTARRMLGERP